MIHGYTVRKPAWLCTAATVSASSTENTAHQTLAGIAVTESSMDKSLYFQRTCLMHGRYLFQGKLSGRNHTSCSLFLQKSHSLRSGYCHLCACMNIQIRKIPAYKRKYSQILYDHRIQPCLIIRKQIFKQLIIQFTVLQKCIHSKI